MLISLLLPLTQQSHNVPNLLKQVKVIRQKGSLWATILAQKLRVCVHSETEHTIVASMGGEGGLRGLSTPFAQNTKLMINYVKALVDFCSPCKDIICIILLCSNNLSSKLDH